MSSKQFRLWVTVVSWVDGDTFRGVLDHGCRIYTGSHSKPPRFRCGLIDAPEIGDPTGAGVEARRAAERFAPPGEYECVSTGLDNYGRPLLDLLLPDTGRLSKAMLEGGYAEPYRP